MNHVVAGLLAVTLIAAAPSSVALVAGGIRDQHGAPIEGATIEVFNGPSEAGTARTAADGTFVFDGSGTKIRIRCEYCRTTEAEVGQDGIATAIVHRYDAVRSEVPTPEDIAGLPGAGVPALLQLVPFIVVNDSARTIPGVSATDRNATLYGGLFVPDSAPDYDITASITPFDTVPQGGSASLSVLRVDQAYLYGDVAQGGTFLLQTPGGTSHAGTGDNSLVSAAMNESNLWASASYSNAEVGNRAERAAVVQSFTTPGTAGSVTLSTGAGYDAPNESGLFSSFSSASAQVHARGPIDAFASAIVDRGTYAYTSANFPVSSIWSDVDVETGVDSHAAVAPFIHFDLRQSSGSYASNQTGPKSIAGWLSQARTNAGASYHSSSIDALVAGSIDSIAYTGIVAPNGRYAQNLNDGVVSLTYRPSPSWSLHASTSSGYTLQTFVGLYVPFEAGLGYGTPVIMGHTNEAILEFGDDARVRAAVTALSWGAANGAASSSAGASVAWQIAPSLSLRTWLLQTQSTAWAPATVGSAWLTYANRDNFRIDAMLGRSLLDHVPYNHIDASVSGRITDRVDWFASSTRISGAQQTAVGLRIR